MAAMIKVPEEDTRTSGPFGKIGSMLIYRMSTREMKRIIRRPANISGTQERSAGMHAAGTGPLMQDYRNYVIGT